MLQQIGTLALYRAATNVAETVAPLTIGAPRDAVEPYLHAFSELLREIDCLSDDGGGWRARQRARAAAAALSGSNLTAGSEVEPTAHGDVRALEQLG